MTTNAGRLIKEALSHLLTVQEVAARPSLSAERVKAIDLFTIREHTHEAVMRLLAADTILSEQAPPKVGQVGRSKLHIQSFYAGVLSALAIIASHDERTLFDEIVKATGEAELVKTARKDGAMRWSGLSKYSYGRDAK